MLRSYFLNGVTMSSQSFIRLFVFCMLFIRSMHAFAVEENFLLINGETNEVITEFGPSINKRMSPCSTFKIALSLMGYDADILKDEINPIWDFQEGYNDWLLSWRDPQSPSSWMKYSCLWYSEVLSQELGLEKIQNYLNSIEYGNRDVSAGLIQPGFLYPFWINSSVEISPREQVEFLQKMIQGKLPISSKAIKMTKAILFKEDLHEGLKLFGKTGWSGSDITRDGKTLEHSWFVGWIENDQNFYLFAYLIRDKKIDLDQRIPRVKQLLIESNKAKNTYKSEA